MRGALDSNMFLYLCNETTAVLDARTLTVIRTGTALSIYKMQEMKSPPLLCPCLFSSEINR